jgi:hypothetical protein
MFLLLNSAHWSRGDINNQLCVTTKKNVGTALTSLTLLTTMAKLRFVDLI